MTRPSNSLRTSVPWSFLGSSPVYGFWVPIRGWDHDQKEQEDKDGFPLRTRLILQVFKYWIVRMTEDGKSKVLQFLYPRSSFLKTLTLIFQEIKYVLCPLLIHTLTYLPLVPAISVSISHSTPNELTHINSSLFFPSIPCSLYLPPSVSLRVSSKMTVRTVSCL